MHSTSATSETQAATKILLDLRTTIDHLNEEILELVQKRADVVLKILRLKQENGWSTHAPLREEEMLRALTQNLAGPLCPSEIEEVFKAVFRSAIALQNRIRGGDSMTETKAFPQLVNQDRDRLFATPRRAEDFTFGGETAVVFDDMLERSVPFYQEVQRMVAEIAADFAQAGTAIYDLGCSTCTTLQYLDQALPKQFDVRLVGVDSSREMLEIAEGKIAAQVFDRPCELRCEDIERSAELSNASVVLLILTLQFVRPLNRERLIRRIYQGLNEKGCLILVEKVLEDDSTCNRLFIEHYYSFKKRQGYSELEIAQKREALENVLIPYRLEENKELLKGQGFRHVDIFWKWYNFCGLLAMK